MHNSDPAPLNLNLAFQDVREALLPHQEALNQADSDRGEHGDEMIELLTVLAAIDEQISPASNLALVFDRSAQLASSLAHNQSAQFYAQGLAHFSSALLTLDLTVTDLALYLHSVLDDSPRSAPPSGAVSQGQLSKALIKGLAAWDSQVGNEKKASPPLGMGYLFDLGVAYLGARQQGASKLEAVVETSIQHTPLKTPAYRADSGRLVIQALLSSILSRASAAS